MVTKMQGMENLLKTKDFRTWTEQSPSKALPEISWQEGKKLIFFAEKLSRFFRNESCGIVTLFHGWPSKFIVVHRWSVIRGQREKAEEDNEEGEAFAKPVADNVQFPWLPLKTCEAKLTEAIPGKVLLFYKYRWGFWDKNLSLFHPLQRRAHWTTWGKNTQQIQPKPNVENVKPGKHTDCFLTKPWSRKSFVRWSRKAEKKCVHFPENLETKSTLHASTQIQQILWYCLRAVWRLPFTAAGYITLHCACVASVDWAKEIFPVLLAPQKQKEIRHWHSSSSKKLFCRPIENTEHVKTWQEELCKRLNLTGKVSNRKGQGHILFEILRQSSFMSVKNIKFLAPVRYFTDSSG